MARLIIPPILGLHHVQPTGGKGYSGRVFLYLVTYSQAVAVNHAMIVQRIFKALQGQILHCLPGRKKRNKRTELLIFPNNKIMVMKADAVACIDDPGRDSRLQRNMETLQTG